MKKLVLALTAIAAFTGSGSRSRYGCPPLRQGSAAGRGRAQLDRLAGSAAAAVTASPAPTSTSRDVAAPAHSRSERHLRCGWLAGNGRRRLRLSVRRPAGWSARSVTALGPTSRVTTLGACSAPATPLSATAKHGLVLGRWRSHRLSGDPGVPDLLQRRLHPGALSKPTTCVNPPLPSAAHRPPGSGPDLNGLFVGSGFEYQLDFHPGPVREDRRSRRLVRPQGLASTCVAAGTRCAGATGLDPFGNINSRSSITYSAKTELVYRFNWGGPVVAKY